LPTQKSSRWNSGSAHGGVAGAAGACASAGVDISNEAVSSAMRMVPSVIPKELRLERPATSHNHVSTN